MTWNFFKIAWRNLIRNKIYSFINILGLSLGLACAMLIMLYVKDEVSYDKFHTDVDTIYRVVSAREDKDGNERKNSNTGFLQGPVFTDNVPEIDAFVRIQVGRKDVKMDTEVVSEDLLYVDPNFFSMFSFPVVYGNQETSLKDPQSVVISEELATKQFGTTDAVGKTLMLREGEAFVPYTVTAITKKCPQNSSIKFDMLLPFKASNEEMANGENWFNSFLNTFVTVKPGSNLGLVNDKIQKTYLSESAEAAKIISERYGDMGALGVYSLQPFTDMHLNKELPAQNGLSDASNPMYSYILSGIALFVLLIACINFVNLTVARSVRRSKEIGIRKVVGGERKQLIVQFLGESFLLCFFAFALAIVLVQLALPVFNELSNKVLALSYLFDAKLILGYMALFIVTGLLAGFYPALVLSNYNPVETLYSRFILSGKNYLQKSLVVLQFALASFLIISTLVIYKQFNFLTTQELGYDDSNLVVVEKEGLTRDQFALFKEQLKSDPNIVDVAGKNNGFWFSAAKVNGEQQVNFAYEIVSESYIPMLDIKFVEGRNFSDKHPSDPTHSIIVNESFVKEAGWKNPIGETVDFWYNEGEKYTVIGVVEDYHFYALNQRISSQIFLMKPESSFGEALIKIKPNGATDALNHIAATFKQVFPVNPYSYVFKDDQNKREYEAEAKWKQIMLFSAILTIFISCIGLFGLSVLSAEKRTKEIGIRKVLGASVNHVVTILSKDFIILVVIALVIAVPIAWLVAGQWLQDYPYRIELGWQIFVAAGALVVFIALSTVSFQAIKAAISNPVKSLRTE